MFSYLIVFAFLSAVVGVSCFIPYIRDIFLGKTKPHAYSWLIWVMLQATGVAAMLGGGAGWGALSLAIGAGLCGFVFLLSLRYGTKNITTFDMICFAGALLALGVYWVLRDPLLSVVFVTIIDLVAFLPTFRKTFEEPWTETPSTYFLSGASSTLALGALSSFNVTTSLYLISLIITNWLCAGMIMVRRRGIFPVPAESKERS